MAQMMCLASFGPFFIFVGLCWLLLAVVGCYGNLLSIKWKKRIEKTHLRPKRRVWHRLGPFLSPWAFVGLRWPSLATQWLLWAFVGLRWPSLAAVGLHGPALAFVGGCWLPWVFVGLRWPLAVVGLREPAWLVRK